MTKKKESSSLMVTEKNLPQGMDLETYKQMLRENMAGIERPEFPLIKILHAGALMFEMPSDTEGETKRIKTFSSQILLHQRVNAYWEKSFQETGGGVPPDCASLDGVTGSVHGECRKCKFNQFGSESLADGSKGFGKACKNIMRIYVRIAQDLLPSLLIVPPTSLREYNGYAVKLTQKGKPLPLVLTKFSLESAQNKQGIKYSKLVLSLEKELSEKEFKEGLVMREVYMDTMKQKPIEAGEKEDEVPF